ncbi:MAG: DUF3043 domain-containing protein [Propionibacteriaceae bacterium]|jgi:hypothetical protein|nr:DUF3043 domain-containing protein [Propionibacteriaceae bacterium]
MGLFSRYDQAPESEPAKIPSVVNPKGPAKKSIPTPTRRQAEQARRDRLQPTYTRKEAKTLERQERYKRMDAENAKTAARPYNEMLRDWVDRRWNFMEFTMPVMLLLLVGLMLGTYWLPEAMYYFPYVMWVAVGLIVADTFLMWNGAKRQLRIFFPDEALKGKLGYVLSRSMQMRRSRNPKPRVKRGAPFVWPVASDRP